MWKNAIKSMDKALVATFSDHVIIHLGSSRRFTNGIFDNQGQKVDAASGFIVDADTTLHLRDVDCEDVSIRTIIEINDQKYMVCEPPEPDGYGMTKLVLSKRDESEQQRSTRIRY